MGNHLDRIIHRSFGGSAERFHEQFAFAHVLELAHRRNFRQPNLEKVETFNLIGSGVIRKHAAVQDYSVLAHGAVRRTSEPMQ